MCSFRDTLRQLIVHRIGKDKFDECLDYINASENFIKAAKSPRVSVVFIVRTYMLICCVFYKKIAADDIDDTFFDHSFTQLYKQVRGTEFVDDCICTCIHPVTVQNLVTMCTYFDVLLNSRCSVCFVPHF